MPPVQTAELHASIDAGAHSIELLGDPAPFTASFSTEQVGDGLWHVTLRLRSALPALAPQLQLQFRHPSLDIQSRWTPNAEDDRRLNPDWHNAPYKSRGASYAPVVAFQNNADRNRLTFALSDVRNTVDFRYGIVEEDLRFRCLLTLFAYTGAPRTDYSVTLRLDTRDQPWHEAIRQVGAWWEAMPENRPAPVPEYARVPLYSTWYSFHQRLEPAALEAECAHAASLGCQAVIVDDGWQTDDNARGYAYCGDWEVTPNKFPDFAGHVARVQAMGLKYILWYAVPFIGRYSEAFKTLKTRCLDHPNPDKPHYTLDPRFPDVREHLIGLYETAVREWNLDGFKLDFIDSFFLGKGNDPNAGHPDMDIPALEDAIDTLMADVYTRLAALKPDILIEFRQSYIGPAMRKYGNMFRAGDCPNDVLSNRRRTIDIRLLCGGTAAHADMLEWHAGETSDAAALQLYATLFSVPQVSIMLGDAPPEHLAMVRRYIEFWNAQRHVLLDGDLIPARPDLVYPLVAARAGGTLIVASYGQRLISPDALPEDGSPDRHADLQEMHLVNVSGAPTLCLDRDLCPALCKAVIRDCLGTIVDEIDLADADTYVNLAIPRCGIATLSCG